MISKLDWDRLLDMSRAKLPGASDALIKNEIFDVLHEFFNISSSWLEDITVHVIAGTSTDPNTTYDLIPSEGQIIRLAGVQDSNFVPQPALMPTIGVLQLAYPVNTNQDFTATVVKNVSLPVEKNAPPTAPDWVLPVWGPVVLDGVLGKMMQQVSKTYSNPTMALYHLKRFLNGIASARSATLARNTIGGAAWGYPRAFRTRNQRGGVSVGNGGFF